MKRDRIGWGGPLPPQNTAGPARVSCTVAATWQLGRELDRMELRTEEQRQVDSRSLLTSRSCWINQPRAPTTKLFVSAVTFPFRSHPGGLVLYLLSKVTSLVWIVTAENVEMALFTETRNGEFQRRPRMRGLEAVSRRAQVASWAGRGVTVPENAAFSLKSTNKIYLTN